MLLLFRFSLGPKLRHQRQKTGSHNTLPPIRSYSILFDPIGLLAVRGLRFGPYESPKRRANHVETSHVADWRPFRWRRRRTIERRVRYDQTMRHTADFRGPQFSFSPPRPASSHGSRRKVYFRATFHRARDRRVPLV